MSDSSARLQPAPDTVFFLSDYGLADEFVGVVHAVLRRLAPRAVVVDISHQVPPFDVRAGAAMLTRALPHLGPGVILAVVDPGVGGIRRAIAVKTNTGMEGRWFVGPDNGLLMRAVDQAGSIELVQTLAALPHTLSVSPQPPVTFDGRDVLAPAVAAICNGVAPIELGPVADPAGLIRLVPPVNDLEVNDLEAIDGAKALLRTEVTWVDRFGNAQLVARPHDLNGAGSAVVVQGSHFGIHDELRVRRVGAYSELEEGEVGLIVDANGHFALVVKQGSAAQRLGLAVGSVISLVW